MNLSEIIKRATLKAAASPPSDPPSDPKVEKKVENVQPLNNELCLCGHDSRSHELGTSDCEVVGCDCISFCPPSQITDVNIPTTPTEVPAESAEKQIETEEVKKEEKVPRMTFTIPPDTKEAPGVTGEMEMPDTVEKDGKLELTVAYQAKIRNATRERCKNMSVDQLTFHIKFLAKQIEELRVSSLEVRKMRAEAEEIELQNLPEEEREKFRQALRRGDKAKAVKASKAKESKAEAGKRKEAELVQTIVKQGKPLDQAKMIASWMLKTGKTQTQVEAFLYE